jgi:glycine/D-amino acid oxidase-like deaminating enzyme
LTAGARYSDVSFWFDSLPESLEPRPALGGDLDVDVAIVGAGYTGLWTAYDLKNVDPALRIAVLEREIAGFGASGRNGGWCSALFPASTAKVARRYGREGAVALQRAMHDAVDEVGRVASSEEIDCHYAKGGEITVARTAAQLQRARSEVAEARRWGFGDDDVRLLDADEAQEILGATSVLGGTSTPHCAAIHPARLARGLASVVERRGVHVFEQTPVTRIEPRRATTTNGSVRADFVVRATVGFTPELPDHRRTLAPVYSLMLATEPLHQGFWDTVGLRRRETFTDYRHLIVYGQRTADNRFAFGGRGAPYHFGSNVQPKFDREPRVFDELQRVLVDLFPAVADARVTHTWGGPLGVPRDWFASVGLDRTTGLAWGGGYVGDGVGTSNLAGRTLADLITGRDTELTRLPWVGHRSRRWEPEPLRWLGVNAGLRLMTSADAAESRTGRPARRAELFGRVIGR